MKILNKEFISKITVKIRYKLVFKIIKYITPNFSYKLDSILLGNQISLGNIQRIISQTPRPAIKLMKTYFKKKGLIGVEIGVKKGYNAKSILKELNISKLYLIDIWNDYNEFGIKNSTNEYYEIVLKKFEKNKKVEIIRDFSEIVVKNIENNSLDFIYIDGNHEYKYVYKDIDLWFEKVRNFGIIAGHDILNIKDVFKAVRDYCLKHQIKFNISAPDWYFIKNLNKNFSLIK